MKMKTAAIGLLTSQGHQGLTDTKRPRASEQGFEFWLDHGTGSHPQVEKPAAGQSPDAVVDSHDFAKESDPIGVLAIEVLSNLQYFSILLLLCLCQHG